MKQRWIAVFLTALLIFGMCSVETRAAKTNVGKDASYTSGSATISIKDVTSGQTTTGVLTVKRSNTIAYADLGKKASTWSCSLDVKGTNHHNLKLNQSTVTSKLDTSNRYFILNFSLSYTQHANYGYSKVTNKTDCPDRINFLNYAQNNSGSNSIKSGYVDGNTTRTVNWQMNMSQLGLRTSYQYRYTGASATIEYNRPSYKVTFVDGSGNTFKTQNVLRGDRATPPPYPVKDGFFFGGWNQSFLNIKANTTVTAKWVSKDGSKPPIAGEDALSVHADLYDDAQTFYVPQVDTELINPNIE